MSRPRAWRRWKNFTKARRKRELDKELTTPLTDHVDGSLQQWLFYKNLHEYSKGKIHCSCPMCSAKTRRNGYKISDLRKIDSLQSSLDEEGIDLKILPKVGGWVY